jgi:hypothetical protein
MLYSMSDANKKLAEIDTKNQLLNLINQLDVSVTGAVTVLYSGPTGDNIHSSDIIKGMLTNRAGPPHENLID